MRFRLTLRVFVAAAGVLLIAAGVSPCEWTEGYFYQVTRLRGTVVGAEIGPLQYATWLRQSFARKNTKLTLRSYRWPIKARADMPVVKGVIADEHGNFDFAALDPGHYTLIVDDEKWGSSQSFDVEVKSLPKETESVVIDISPNFPDCKGGHTFTVKTK